MVDHVAIHRRGFLGGLSAALVLPLVPGRAHARASGTRRVLVLGGSTMTGALGSYLEKALREAGYEPRRKAKSSSGLARPDFFDWQAEASKLYASFHPHATLVMFGGNDGQGLRMPASSDREWIRWGEEGWTEEYTRRVDAFADTLAPNGEHLFWLGMPAMRQAKLDARIRHMNSIFEARMAARRNGHYIETRSVLSGGSDRYADSIRIDGKMVRVRAPDGMHLARGGAILLVEHVIPRIREQLSASS